MTALPTIGALVRVRGDVWVVTGIDGNGSTHHRCRLLSVSEDHQGQTLDVIWEVEPGRAVGTPHKDVAAHLEISTKTIQRRLSDPTFRHLLIGRRRVVLSETTAHLVALSTDAVGTLGALLASENPSIQLRATQLALTLAPRFHRDDRHESEFEERIERLINILEDTEGGAK